MQILTIPTALPQSGIIGFVPTMGALHAGHLELVRRARAMCEVVIVSIFVNPTQFAAGEDFNQYPRVLEDDIALLAAEKVDFLYAPTPQTIYPPHFVTTVTVGGELTNVLCGAHRAGHFAGVATVVAILLGQVSPNYCFLGEKDYQQLCVIRQMVTDLWLPLQIIPVATVREADGLALSSRNRYLSPDERLKAALLPAVLQKTVTDLQADFREWQQICAQAKSALAVGGFSPIQYLEPRHQDTLTLPNTSSDCSEYRLFAAAYMGKTRLIDNFPL